MEIKIIYPVKPKIISHTTLRNSGLKNYICYVPQALSPEHIFKPALSITVEKC